MNEQLIAQLQLLIELAKTGEEFEFKTLFGKWKLIDNQLCQKKVEGNYLPFELDLNYFVCKTDIIRKPWKPTNGESYWYWCYIKDRDFFIPQIDKFEFDTSEIMASHFGNCFRTKEECESHTEVRDKLIAMRKEYE